MKEFRRRALKKAARRLKAAETSISTAKTEFNRQVHDAVKVDGCSLGDVSKTLSEVGRPISRQRVHQILGEVNNG